MKVFVCLAYVKNPKHEKSEFYPKTQRHIFLGCDIKSTAYLLQDSETRKLIRARNVVFNERKVVGLTNELREEENDLLFDATFDEKTEIQDKKMIVKLKNMDKNPKKEFRSEVDGENSSRSESEDQVERSRRVTLSPEVQASTFPPKRPTDPSPPRPSRTLVISEMSQKASDVQQTSKIVKPKTKLPSKLDMAKQLSNIGLLSSTDKCIERWSEHRDMQDARREAKELKREERSRSQPQRYDQSYHHISTFFPKEPKFTCKP